MKIDERGSDEPYTRQKIKARTGGEKGRHLRPRLVQEKTAEGISSFELSWKVKAMIKKRKRKKKEVPILQLMF